MPLYDYRCQACHNRVSIQQSYAEYGVKRVSCPVCGSSQLTRIIGRVRIAKSEDQRLDNMSDPSFLGDVDENDPKSVARWARKMGQELGEDAGDDFKEAIEQMEAGEMPADGDESSPDLGAADDL